MDEYEREALDKQRYYHVVKGNELVQKSRYELSLPEQKTIAYICSMIKPVDVTDSVQASRTNWNMSSISGSIARSAASTMTTARTTPI